MQHRAHTVFDSPVVNTLLRGLSLLILRLCGWKVEGGRAPAQKKACARQAWVRATQ